MKTEKLPLKEISIEELYNGEKSTYEVPIYQRNFAWEKEEINALIQDVLDACFREKKYFIGTLVSFLKGDSVYEVIDGQQRLTTIYLILYALGIKPQNELKYRAREKANNTIKNIPDFAIDEKDEGIVAGYNFAKDAITTIVGAHKDNFQTYFLENVHIIHYKVPKDIDLNHYFEIMNSRGEQLEKHEIIKARLLEKLNDQDKTVFNRIWESCCEMNVYIQNKFDDTGIFGKELDDFAISLNNLFKQQNNNTNIGKEKISKLIELKGINKPKEGEDKKDTFQPIIDFSNFLLIVLKLTLILEDSNFNPNKFILDDKELIKEFNNVVNIDEKFVKIFGFNLLKAKYFLDNYIVHHTNEDEKADSNPWQLQKWQKSGKRGYLKNLDGDNGIYQNKLVQLLSMFEVSFTARQRKNYLFYCLLYLFRCNDIKDIGKYSEFVSNLAKKYFYDVYLDNSKLSDTKTPNPGSFDDTVLIENKLCTELKNINFNFCDIYKTGFANIPLFVFNFLDYILWEKYFNEARNTLKTDNKRKIFFDDLGCNDFGLDVFQQFYFSRTRRSLEHYFPQANEGKTEKMPTKAQINCFGNFAMIGSDANSSGSNLSPIEKNTRYLIFESGKIRMISVASIKFRIMMQICNDNYKIRKPGYEWIFEDIQNHQEKMLDLLTKYREPL